MHEIVDNYNLCSYEVSDRRSGLKGFLEDNTISLEQKLDVFVQLTAPTLSDAVTNYDLNVKNW